MSNNEELKQETIDTKTDNKIEYVSMETVAIPDYSYGNGEQTLDYKVAIRNKPTGAGEYFLLLMGA